MNAIRNDSLTPQRATKNGGQRKLPSTRNLLLLSFQHRQGVLALSLEPRPQGWYPTL